MGSCDAPWLQPRSQAMKQMSVSVIGLGMMGSTIAELYLKGGASVTIWNRSPGKAERLLAAGAAQAAGLAAAFSASETIVMCVANGEAVSELLATPGVGAAIAGRTLIQLTTISAETARS